MICLRWIDAGIGAGSFVVACFAALVPAVQAESGYSTGALTPEALVAAVLDANPGLEAAEAAAESAAARIDSVGALADPTLGYTVAPLTAGGDGGLRERVEFGQSFPWPGTLALREAAARFEAVASRREVEALRLRVASQAKAAYAEWRFVHAALDIHRDTQGLVKELIAATEARYAAGRALKQDVLQAEVEFVELDNRILGLLRLEKVVLARINALLNRKPDSPLAPAEQIAVDPSLPPMANLYEMAEMRHPELARLDALVSAADRRIQLAEKAFYPDFRLSGGYNSLRDRSDKRPLIGLSVNLPLDRRKRRADLGRAEADRRSMESVHLEARADLLAAVARARARVDEAIASITLYEQRLLPLAEEYLQAALADYRSGGGAFLNVIVAEQRKLEVALALARTRSDYLRHLADLERWVGGPLEPKQPNMGTFQ